MPMRAQALRFPEQALKSTSPFLLFLFVVVSTGPSDVLRASLLGRKLPMELSAVLLALIGAVAFAGLRDHCQDLTTPRRIGRRI